MIRWEDQPATGEAVLVEDEVTVRGFKTRFMPRPGIRG
jgi:hypothetical protein